MPEDRNARRMSRYMYLRSLGFSSKDARRLRDQSGPHIESAIRNERRRISRKKISNRTPQEKERLRKTQEYQGKISTGDRRRRYESRTNRYQDFSHWSSKHVGFPGWALQRIRQYNRERGLNRYDPYGYRRFYYWYVERISDFENEFYADRGDSGIRHQYGIPLRSRKEIRRSRVA